MLLQAVSCLLTGYLLGSVSSSVVLSNLIYHKDVRSIGSGNAGATNMARSFGVAAGAATLLCDVLKVLLGCLFGRLILGEWGLFFAGVGCLLGHAFPLYFGFRGGKCVSVGTAFAILLGWKVLLLSVASFFLPAVLSKRVSVGSLIAALLLPVWAIVFKLSLPLCLLAGVTAISVIVLHIPNIKRLLRGEEPRFEPKRTGSK